MPLENRIELLKQLEEKRSSKIITYITGDRPPFTMQITNDAIVIFRKHLDSIGKQDKIGLFLYSRGGDMMTPLRLVRLIREYCNFFEVLIPYRAHSAATLISLGADKIVLGKLGELSPIDPTTDHPFNPDDPTDPKKTRKVRISVEDLTSYFMLAREKAEVREEQMGSIFNELTNKIHPLALGNIYRGYRMIRILAEKLLLFHLDKNKDKHIIDNVIKKLTEELCIHGYLISRNEADKDLGLKVEEPDEDLENLIWRLYKTYEEAMELTKPFDPVNFLGDEKTKSFSYYGAFVESTSITDGFLFNGEIRATTTPTGQIQASVNMISQPKWVEVPRQN